ncbi:MAG: helix-turn-helix domain-containing protein, partial [Phormidesmis sp.]
MTKFSAPQQSQLAQIGAFLRENREKQEKSLEDIAIRTYIRPQLLNGIEKGDPDLLPEPIFVQGFIRRYAEALGLKGTELAQQFTVTSIPSTPRPAQQPAPANSTSTRISRTTPNQPPSPQNSATTPILSKASSPLPNDPFFNGSQINGSQINSSQNQPDSSSSPAAVAPASEVEKTKAKETTEQTVEVPPAKREDLPAGSSIVTNGRSAAISPETSSFDNLPETGPSGNVNLLEQIDEQPDEQQPDEQQPVSNDAAPAALDTPTEQHSAPIAAANAVPVSEVETSDTFDEVLSNGTRSYQPGPESNDFDRDRPATPTTEMTPEAAPV